MEDDSLSGSVWLVIGLYLSPEVKALDFRGCDLHETSTKTAGISVGLAQRHGRPLTNSEHATSRRQISGEMRLTSSLILTLLMTGWKPSAESALMLAELHLEAAEKPKPRSKDRSRVDTASSFQLHLQVQKSEHSLSSALHISAYPLVSMW